MKVQQISPSKEKFFVSMNELGLPDEHVRHFLDILHSLLSDKCIAMKL